MAAAFPIVPVLIQALPEDILCLAAYYVSHPKAVGDITAMAFMTEEYMVRIHRAWHTVGYFVKGRRE